jgi:hypothetical protein
MHLTHFSILLATTFSLLDTSFAAAISTSQNSLILVPSKTVLARAPGITLTATTPTQSPPSTPSVLDSDFLTAFLSLITTITDTDLASPQGTSEFFIKVRNCLSGTLQGIFISNLPILVSASSQFASITSAVPAAIASAIGAVESKASNIASVATEIPAKATSIANVVESRVTALIPQITSAVGEIPKVVVPAVTSVLADVGGDIGNFFGGLFGKRQVLDTVKCSGIAVKTTVVFKVGNCVIGLAGARVYENIINLRTFVEDAGGVALATSNVDVLNVVATLGQEVEGCRGMVSGSGYPLHLRA